MKRSTGYFGDIADYGVGLASMPSVASDEDGRLFVIYSSLAEDRDQGIQTYRHVYLVNSEDGGETWNSGTPCDLTPDLDYNGYECVFASISPDVDGHLDIVYQRDFEPGLNVRGDEDPVSLNDMVHLQIPLDQLSGCVLIAGCTDPEACNYDSGSTLDDGSCNYHALVAQTQVHATMISWRPSTMTRACSTTTAACVAVTTVLA